MSRRAHFLELQFGMKEGSLGGKLALEWGTNDNCLSSVAAGEQHKVTFNVIQLQVAPERRGRNRAGPRLK
jgi:hypothetical protein